MAFNMLLIQLSLHSCLPSSSHLGFPGHASHLLGKKIILTFQNKTCLTLVACSLPSFKTTGFILSSDFLDLFNSITTKSHLLHHSPSWPQLWLKNDHKTNSGISSSFSIIIPPFTSHTPTGYRCFLLFTKHGIPTVTLFSLLWSFESTAPWSCGNSCIFSCYFISATWSQMHVITAFESTQLGFWVTAVVSVVWCTQG